MQTDTVDEALVAQHVPGLSLSAYHDRPEWSHSQIEVLLESAPLFYGRFISREFPKPASDVFDDGTIVHTVLTHDQRIEDILAIIPGDVLNAHGHRKGALWNDWWQANAGRIQRKRDECDALFRMVDSVRAHPKARWLLEGEGEFEYSIIWRDEETGLSLRARPDKLSFFRGDCLVSDIKTTRSFNPRTFGNDVAKYGYHRQAAWYIDGVTALGWHVPAYCFITVDKTPAHETHVYELMPSAIELGRQQNRQLLTELKHRLETGDWNAPDHDSIIELDMPTWAYREDQRRIA